MALKGISEKGSYLLNDNGHINQRSSQFFSQDGRSSPRLERKDPVGPGSYEVSSTFLKAGKTNKTSPYHEKASEKQFRITAPSIPSKFLTPFIDGTLSKEQSAVIMQNEFCQISKLIDDPSKLGPGTYNIAGNITS